MIAQIPSEVINQIPDWFLGLLAFGSLGIISAGATAFVRYVISKNKTEMTEMKTAIVEMSKSVIEVAAMVKVHEYRITDQATDIKELQRQMNGHHIVKYTKE